MSFAMSAAPVGWYPCDGTTVSRTGSGANLFAAIGIIHGVGNNSTTFNVPNLQGQFIRGLTTNLSTTSRDPLSGSRVLGSVQSDEFKSHNHGGITGDDSPDHSHQYTRPLSVVDNDRGGSSSIWSVDNNQTVSSGGASARHQHSVSSQGGLETRPINLALLYCIKL
jgi:microcystin-dependent protein